jgi:hypothetical protein
MTKKPPAKPSKHNSSDFVKSPVWEQDWPLRSRVHKYNDEFGKNKCRKESGEKPGQKFPGKNFFQASIFRKLSDHIGKNLLAFLFAQWFYSIVRATVDNILLGYFGEEF